MNEKLDLSLDEIIEQSKKTSAPRGASFRPRKGRQGRLLNLKSRPNPVGTKRGVRGMKVDGKGKRKKDSLVRRRGGSNQRPSRFPTASFPLRRSIPHPTPPTQKLFLSNLGYRVSQNDVVELFSQIGPLKNARVNYDRKGHSLGTGEVIFEVPAHAALAEQRFNGILIDSQPLVVETFRPNQTNAPTKLSSGITVILNPSMT